MSKSIFVIFIFFLSLALAHSEELRQKGHMGYLLDGLHDVKHKDAKLAFSLWVDELAAEEEIDVGIKYYEDAQELSDAYESSNIDYITINPYFLLKNKAVFYDKSQEFWMVQKAEEQFEEYLILVRADAKIESIKDLKNKTVFARSDDYMGRLILDMQILKVAHLNASEYLLSLENIDKFSTAILKTYFGKADACIVPSYVFAMVQEMNPDVGKKLKVLHRSEKIFMPVLGAFHNKTSQIMLEKFAHNALTLEESARGQNILNLFKMKKMVRIKPKNLEPLFAYYNEYMALKQKYELRKD
jgi:ABC-type phosphate/phosphonate transport system substrate-binding protein